MTKTPSNECFCLQLSLAVTVQKLYVKVGNVQDWFEP